MLSLRLPPELHEALKERADAEYRSLNSLIVFLLRQVMSQQPPTKSLR